MRLSPAAQETYQYELDCGTTHANALARAERVMRAEHYFDYGVDEPDYGGAFDGFTVSSDADCGL